MYHLSQSHRSSTEPPANYNIASPTSNRCFSKVWWVLLIVALLAICVPSAYAVVPSAQEMEQVCENWLTSTVYQKGEWAGSASPVIVETTEIRVGDTLLARYYSVEPRGFVLVPALKELGPVKAYSDRYDLDDRQEG